MFIKDEALREAVARNLKIKEDELTPESLQGLIHLEVPDMEIKSLEGLQYAENLEFLDASGNNLQSLEPIRDLRNVFALDGLAASARSRSRPWRLRVSGSRWSAWMTQGARWPIPC